MAGVAFALFIILLLGAAAIFLSLKLMQNFKPGRSKIQKDLQKIKAELKPWIADLVPWSKEEMEQLSLNQVNRKTTKGVATTAKGIFTTIYHEPLIAYFFKQYVSSGENALLYARTSNHEFIYRMKKGMTEVVVDNQFVGTVDNRGRLSAMKGNKMLAQINRDSEELLLPVKVNEREVGRLVNPSRARKANPRAFELMSEMGPEEEAMFLSLAILELVRRKA